MSYDLLVKNGRIIDGSGRPAFHGDVGVARGKIVETGRLDGPAKRTIEADGRVIEDPDALGLVRMDCNDGVHGCSLRGHLGGSVKLV